MGLLTKHLTGRYDPQEGLSIVKTELAKANVGRQLNPTEIFAQEYVINNYLTAREAFINESRKEFTADNVVSSDIGKFAIPRMEATKSIDYHEAGSALAKARTQELLVNPATRDLDVLFMAGGSGAGKSRSLREMGIELGDYAVTHDSNLDKFGSAIKKIEDVFDSGRKVQIIYVYRDPIVAYEQGVIPRIKKQNRVVPIKQHIETHLGARTNIERLMDEYGDKIKFTIIDNTGRKGETKKSSIDKIPEIRYALSELEDKLYEVSKNAFQRQEITVEILQAILIGVPRLQAKWESEASKSRCRKLTYGISGVSSGHWPNPRRLETTPSATKHLSNPEVTIPIFPLKKNLQIVTDKITDKYGVSHIKIETSDLSAKGKAAYRTFKIKGGRINFPRDIVIYNFKEIAGYPGEIIQALAHELAHHISNMKRGSLQHDSYHGELEDEIGFFISKNYSDLLRVNPEGKHLTFKHLD